MNQALAAKPASPVTSAPLAETFLISLSNAQRRSWPFSYWLLDTPIPDDCCEPIVTLPFAPPKDAIFNGKRETNNSTRVYFTPENQEKFDVCRRLVQGFKDQRVIESIEDITGTDLSDGHLRIEYCQDTDGFWLEPHTDIFVKKFTMVIYLSDDPNLKAAGTDIHEGPPDFKYVASAPYAKNKAVMFIPGENTWHGVGNHRFKGVRRSLIVNYVTSAWRDGWELA